MNNKKLSTLLTQAIVALQGCAAEIKKEEECECTRLQRKAAQQKQKRFCKCMDEFGPVFAPPVPPRPMAHSLPPRELFTSTPTLPPAPQWGVTGEPEEDQNKVFGVNVRVDEPRIQDYPSRWAFERDHAKFDRLVDAAEACTWQNKSNTAPLTKVNAIRRRVEDGPVMGVNLVGETHWF